MKKIVSGLLAGMMLISSSMVFAGTVNGMSSITEEEMDAMSSATKKPVKVVEEVVEETNMPFQVEINGDVFKLIIEENPTTGYEWQYTINKEDHVKFISSDYIAPNTNLVGAGGEKEMTFEVLGEGVSTITLNLKRSWEEDVEETIEVLVYKNGDKVFIEEDQIVTIQDQAMDSVGGIEIGLDISAVTISTVVDDEIEVLVNKAVLEEGVLMLPLAESLRNLGYEVKWNSETSSVDIIKGAQWTSVKGGVNAYTKNRMAPMTLSAAPTYIDGVTYVPAEFFSKILDLSFTVDSGNITLREGLMAIHEGFVKDISYDETGGMTITLTAVKGSEEITDWTIIHTSKAFTYYQKEVKVGEWISAVSPAMMTMSLPGQTSAYIIY